MNYIDLISKNDIKKLKRTFLPVTMSCYIEADKKLKDHIVEISKNEKVKVLATLNDELDYLESKFNILVTIGLILEHRESDIAILKLNELGYSCSDRESGLKRIKSALKNLSINIKIKLKQIEDKKGDEPQKATDKSEFIAQKQILNKQGYMITEKSSTADYIISIGLIRDEIKRVEHQKQRRKR